MRGAGNSREAQSSRMGVKLSEPKDSSEELLTPLGLEIFIDAFTFLQNDRPQSMGKYMLSIPSSAIFLYCAAHDWDNSFRMMTVDILKAMDQAYLEHFNKKARRQKDDADSVHKKSRIPSTRPRRSSG